ncbi:MAG: hypothetical protein JXD18_12195 [Anaerolineae bacterium]|nr:hypothetical protein [Anaerolineae bacterium]
MSEKQSIVELVDDLPRRSITTIVLEALDFVVPGEWNHITGFDNLVRAVAGTDAVQLKRVGHRVREIYDDPSTGYQKAMKVYRVVDDADVALAAAAMADKASQKIRLLSFLDRMTPKSDVTQAIDLAVKVGAEIVAFSMISNLPQPNIREFTSGLAAYSGASKMRMAALVCIDGVIPLGPDFAQGTMKLLDRIKEGDLEQSRVFQRLKDVFPGDGGKERLGFLRTGFDAVKGWMDSLVRSRNLTPQNITGNIKRFVDISDESLDYLGAFLDATTNYYELTGTQDVARHLIRRAIGEVGPADRAAQPGPAQKKRK